MFCTNCQHNEGIIESLVSPWSPPCEHVVHRHCLARWVANSEDHGCSVCRAAPKNPLIEYLCHGELDYLHHYMAAREANVDTPPTYVSAAPVRPAPVNILPCCCPRAVGDATLYHDRRMYWSTLTGSWDCYSCGRTVDIGDPDLLTPSRLARAGYWSARATCMNHGHSQALVTEFVMNDCVLECNYSMACVRTCASLPLEVPHIVECDQYANFRGIPIGTFFFPSGMRVEDDEVTAAPEMIDLITPPMAPSPTPPIPPSMNEMFSGTDSNSEDPQWDDLAPASSNEDMCDEDMFFVSLSTRDRIFNVWPRSRSD